ncbi:ADP-ribose pyrophosphatase YjhB (NUDIX family)/predicted enzyme related to lactoylglutathione lyase [Prosthecomicrobium pneumaticum]|uniref:ADP-ribose pyrophosphatase YjhB (NUDIX family)/predicted enzyme related to lactoylglutathione lyase n=1 Tax=Prosthecomicrobium pneumaticum TaxID=81895 RepID=A0A7W9CUU7_9HYPH|nr:ADP-ribose pyrophosphatase YjhB (NUDIX family)/predicted enzyme related to lactoylglutathione lyase [Prosthecomicrobium pneumaticum]
MKVRRIVANIGAPDPATGRSFYGAVLGLVPAMDLGWIATFAAEEPALPQLSLAREGGGGAPLPAVSIEVDDVDEAHRRVVASGVPILRDLADEPWGVRRFLFEDPFGTRVAVLAHRPPHRPPAGPPRLGVSTALFSDRGVLLVRRGRPPLAGLWSLPGGRVRTGETLEAAARRELAEETGASAGPLVQVTALDLILPAEGSHFVVLVHAGRLAGSEIAAADDAAALAWVSQGAIAGMATTPGLAAVVAQAAARLAQGGA